MSDIAPDICFHFLSPPWRTIYANATDLVLGILLLELIPRAIGRRISAFERHCERLIRMKIIYTLDVRCVIIVRELISAHHCSLFISVT